MSNCVWNWTSVCKGIPILWCNVLYLQCVAILWGHRRTEDLVGTVWLKTGWDWGPSRDFGTEGRSYEHWITTSVCRRSQWETQIYKILIRVSKKTCDMTWFMKIKFPFWKRMMKHSDKLTAKASVTQMLENQLMQCDTAIVTQNTPRSVQVGAGASFNWTE